MTHSWLEMIQTSVGSIIRNLEGMWDDWHGWLSDLPAPASTLLEKESQPHQEPKLQDNIQLSCILASQSWISQSTCQEGQRAFQ